MIFGSKKTENSILYCGNLCFIYNFKKYFLECLRAVYVTVYVRENQHTSIPVGILVKYLKGFLFERKKPVREILVILHFTVGEPNVLRFFPLG